MRTVGRVERQCCLKLFLLEGPLQVTTCFSCLKPIGWVDLPIGVACMLLSPEFLGLRQDFGALSPKVRETFSKLN